MVKRKKKTPKSAPSGARSKTWQAQRKQVRQASIKRAAITGGSALAGAAAVNLASHYATGKRRVNPLIAGAVGAGAGYTHYHRKPVKY